MCTYTHTNAHRTLYNSNGEFDRAQFRAMMEGEMKRYALRELSSAMAEGDRQIARLGVVLKMLAVSIETIEQELWTTKVEYFRDLDKERTHKLSLTYIRTPHSLFTTKVEYFRDLDKERAATLAAIQRRGSSSSTGDGGGGSGELAGTSKVMTENGKGGAGSRGQENGDGNAQQRLMETVTSLASTGVCVCCLNLLLTHSLSRSRN